LEPSREANVNDDALEGAAVEEEAVAALDGVDPEVNAP